MKQGIVPDLVSIKRIIQEYYKQPYTRAFDNLEEMAKFFGKQKLTKLT